jgi:dGTPase
VADANNHAAKLITDLFSYLESSPEKMGRKARSRIETDGLHRAIGDYISGMTDRYLSKQHAELLGG